MSEKKSAPKNREIGIYVVAAIAFWALAVVASFVLNANQHLDDVENLALNEARANFNKDQSVRIWATKHGGVYVPIDERTQPNPYLAHIPERDITTTSGKRLTLMNPAYMLRQMMEEHGADYGIQGDITSLKPLNPINEPDDWERTALLAFEQGAKEFQELTTINGQPYLRLMRPMITQKGCLKCHAHQGYAVGDVRGGVGVSVPMTAYEQLGKRHITQSAFTHAGVLILGLTGIGYLGWVSRKRYEVFHALQQTQQALVSRTERLANAQRIAHVGNWQWDLHNDGLYWSKEIYHIFGLTPGQTEVTYAGFMERVHADDRKLVEMSVAAALKSKPYNIYHRIVRPDGTERIVHEMGEVEFSDDGEPMLMNGTVHDVTEPRKMAIELEETRHYLQNIIDSMPSVLIGVDVDGNVTHWNDQAQRLSGITFNDARGQALDRIIPQLSAYMARVQAAVDTNEPEMMSKVAFSMNGETRFSDIVIYPLVANSVHGAVVRLDDVTDRVRIEEMMVQTEKMLSVGGLAAGMAHEINNPLSGMLQSMQNVRRRLDADFEKNLSVAAEVGLDLQALQRYMDKRGIEGFFDAIHEAGGRASTIVQNMLQFSRKAKTYKEAVELGDMIDRSLDIASVDYDLKKKYDFRSIEIVRNYDPALPPVPCVFSEMQQVLLNVLGNAAQALQEQSGREGPPCITVSTSQVGDDACITIADNGPGMGEETKRRVFEPFYTTKPVGQGTGLGLSVSYFIITDGHGGRIDVESAPGEGAKFMLYLPMKVSEGSEQND